MLADVPFIGAVWLRRFCGLGETRWRRQPTPSPSSQRPPVPFRALRRRSRLQRQLKGVGDAGHVVAPGNVPDDIHGSLWPEGSGPDPLRVAVRHFGRIVSSACRRAKTQAPRPAGSPTSRPSASCFVCSLIFLLPGPRPRAAFRCGPFSKSIHCSA